MKFCLTFGLVGLLDPWFVFDGSLISSLPLLLVKSCPFRIVLGLLIFFEPVLAYVTASSSRHHIYSCIANHCSEGLGSFLKVKLMISHLTKTFTEHEMLSLLISYWNHLLLLRLLLKFTSAAYLFLSSTSCPFEILWIITTAGSL